MTRNSLRARLFSFAVILGALVQLSACQVSAEQAGGAGAALQALADVTLAFIEDFARQVLQAAVL